MTFVQNNDMQNTNHIFNILNVYHTKKPSASTVDINNMHVTSLALRD